MRQSGDFDRLAMVHSDVQDGCGKSVRLRNLIQNAVDFARSLVWIDLESAAKTMTLRIVADGAGFAQHIVGRSGDPFIRLRRYDPALHPHDQGMAFGLFIAKTLLERGGAKLTSIHAAGPFLARSERPDRCGAVVEAIWPKDRLLAPADLAHGSNRPDLTRRDVKQISSAINLALTKSPISCSRGHGLLWGVASGCLRN